MVFGRLSIDEDHFLTESVLNLYRPVAGATNPFLSVKEQDSTELKRAVFRGSAGDDYGKRLRWTAEKYAQAHLESPHLTRNNLLYEPADWFANRSTNSTDILIETFVPPDRFNAFIGELQSVIPRHKPDLLNITICFVREDRDSMLRSCSYNNPSTRKGKRDCDKAHRRSSIQP